MIFETVTPQTSKIVDRVMPLVNMPEAFECNVNPIMDCIIHNLHESQAITANCNVLLPK